ncbi:MULTISPECIES: ribonuclease domain-containing protein [unclassified Luteimonas]
MARGKARGTTPRSWIWLVAALCLFGMWQVLERESGPGLPPAADTHALPDSAPTLPPPARGDGGTRSDPALAFLPAEAHATLALIDRGGPFPHRQDGSVFQNRERLLPERQRGHYREYTVDTPGLGHRGARRIVTGGDPPAEWYYTADHYRSFRAFQRRDRP